MCGLVLIKKQYILNFFVLLAFQGFQMTEQDIHLIYSNVIVLQIQPNIIDYKASDFYFAFAQATTIN